MTAIERAELLQRAEELVENRAFGMLEELLSDVHLQDPLLRFFNALAHSHNGKDQLALRELNSLLENIKDDSNRLYLRALNLEGVMLMESGQYDAAKARFERVLSLASQRRDLRFIASASLNLGTAAAVRHEWSRSILSLQRAMAFAVSIGNRHYVAGCHHNLAMVFRDTRRLSSAASHFQSASDLYRLWGTDAERLATECEASLMVVLAGDSGLAMARVNRAVRTARWAGLRRLEGEALRIRGVVAAHRHEYQHAISDLRTARRIGREVDNPLLLAEATELLGAIMQYISSGRRGLILSDEARKRFGALNLPGGKADLWLPEDFGQSLPRAS